MVQPRFSEERNTPGAVDRNANASTEVCLMLPGFHALSMAWLFALLVPLVAFYFLKLKRPRQDVSSLALWQQVLNDQRVNSPFQKFKRNLLLLLQILLLLLLVLAAMQPFLQARPDRLKRLPILIDCSASMAALDKPGGQSRLDAAKEKVRKLIDGMLPEQEYCLVAFAGTARKVVGFTNNKRVLLDGLDTIVVEDVASEIEDALRMAQALARTEPFDEVLLLTDGNVPARADFELSFKIDYQQLPAAGANMGITALSARRASEESWELFVQVDGSAEGDGPATLEVWQDDKSIGKEHFALVKGGSQRMTFTVSADKPMALTLRLTVDGFDALASDNTAYIGLPAARPLWVYVPASMRPYRHALAVLKGVRVFPEEGRPLPDGMFDLVIADKPEDFVLDGRVKVSVGFVPADLENLMTINHEGRTSVVDWRRTSPLLQHVELSDLVIMDQPRLKNGVGEGDLENAGYEVVAYGALGPLLVEKQGEDRSAVAVLFHTDRSTLPYRIGFPIFVANLVQRALEQTGLAEARGGHTGVLAPVKLAANTVYQVTDPNGEKREEPSGTDGMVVGVPAARVGEYVFASGGTEARRVGASLLSPTETSLKAAEQIEFNEQLSVAAASVAVKSDWPLWRLLVLCGLGVLLVEWWFFQRRMK
jgi:hypothetical protein